MPANNYRFDPLSEKLDLIWSGESSQSDEKKKFSNYYDYYFSGEDIKVYIDGLFNPEDELDIGAFTYVIKQEKQPLYGFWSYNYDAMLYGTRLISGEFTVFSRYPRRMTELIEKASSIRAKSPVPNKSAGGVKSKLRSSESNYGKNEKANLKNLDDEKNIQKYWSYSQLDRITEDPFSKNVVDSQHNIFSAHPPFNFIILYGVQEASLSPKDYYNSQNKIIVDNFDRMILTDVNERIVKLDNGISPMKIVLQEVQLLSMTTAYTPGGQPIAENYQFLARDFYTSDLDLSFIKRSKTVSTSEEPKQVAPEEPTAIAASYMAPPGTNIAV